ncbi:uncharacterized protein LOC131215560 [Anopheles bellator]|uniref:uncharacterized protein LOC131215560 n=1 Tax=Anopheles bellator TaxID=139047 RepID=UPI00264A13C3|nr:uncharacterized protein LOC131215560 [Anopheles bellator]
MLGVLTGVIYRELQQRSINLADSKVFRAVWYLNFPFALLTMLPSYMFYVQEFQKPSLWMAVYFVVSKNLIGIELGVLFLGMIFGVSRTTQRVLNYRFFEPLGRLAYGAYLSHPLVMRYMYVSARGPVYYSDLLTVTMWFGSVVLSCLVALLLCFLIELPTTSLQNHLFGGLMGRKKPNRVDPEAARNGGETAIVSGLEVKKTDL